MMISLAFMELLLTDTSMQWIRTGAIYYRTNTVMILSSEPTWCFLCIIPTVQYTFVWKLKAHFKSEEFYLQDEGSNRENTKYVEKKLCEGVAWQEQSS